MTSQSAASDLPNSDDTPPLRRRWDKGEKRFLTASLLGIALLVGGLLWFGHLNEMPNPVIPSPTLPSPNAFDTYNRAYALLAPQPKVAVDEGVDMEEVTDPKERARRYSLKRKEAWLAQNAPALKLWRQGVKRSYMEPPKRSFSTLMPSFGRYREMARRVAIESKARALRGDTKGAANSALDLAQFGHQIPRGGIVISALVGLAIQQMSYKQLWIMLPTLDAATSKEAAQRLEQIYSSRVTAAQIYREEKWLNQAGLLEMMEKPAWRRDIVSLSENKSPWKNWRFFFISKRDLMDNYTRAMDAVIVESKKPFIKSQAISAPDDPFSQASISSLDMSYFIFTRYEASTSLLITALALHAYNLEHGTYPETLSALAPEYLKVVPTDPFNTSALRYKKQGAGYLLWSIGPDKKDNGGQPIPPSDNPLFRSAYPSEDSRPRDAKAQGDWIIRLPQTTAR